MFCSDDFLELTYFHKFTILIIGEYMKKGFTLVEVLGVIGILGIIALIAVTSYQTVLNNTRKDAYDRQVNTILQVSKDWTLKHIDSLTKEENEKNILLISTLLEEHYLENQEIINPITEENMGGCVIITWNSSYLQFDYEYEEDINLCTN